MNRTSPLRRFNYSHAILVVGIVLALFVVMFRPSGAVADLPTRANVFVKYDDSDYAEVKIADLAKVTRDYDVIPNGKGKPVSSSLTGVPLVEFLKAVGTEDLSEIAFVRVRLNTTNDSRLALVPLGEAGAERPPLMLASGKVSSRSLGTPALVPGQPGSDPIRQDNIVSFSKKEPYVQIIPSKPGSKLLRVKMHKSKTSSGQYKLSASVQNGSGAPTKYQWFQTDAKGNQALIGSGKSVTTTATGKKDVVVSVVVTETSTGSMGQSYMSYIPKSDEQGSTKDPGTGTGTGTGGGGSGSGGGSGTGSGSGFGTGSSPGAINAAPTPYTPPRNNTSPTTPQPPVNPTTPTPTPATGTPSEVDTSAITNIAQNASGTGGLKLVNGVLLSSPTVAAASGGGGSPISALPAPVADQLNSIFQPVDDAEDVWAYLLAILFAFSISGAVREWVKP